MYEDYRTIFFIDDIYQESTPDPSPYEETSGDGEWAVNRGKYGRVSGYDQPAGEVIQHTSNILVLKVKGHSYWAARGIQNYAPAEFQVYDMSEAYYQKVYKHWKKCKLIGRWDVRANNRHVACIKCTENLEIKGE